MARILIIEDSPVNMEVLTVLLSNEGHELFLAERALPGIEIARQQRLDLILMDITMPGVDGIEAAKMLRAHPTTRAVPLRSTRALSFPPSLMASRAKLRILALMSSAQPRRITGRWFGRWARCRRNSGPRPDRRTSCGGCRKI